jgi:hypothetical protein
MAQTRIATEDRPFQVKAEGEASKPLAIAPKRIGLPCSHTLGARRARPGDCPAVSLYDLRKGRSPW